MYSSCWQCPRRLWNYTNADLIRKFEVNRRNELGQMGIKSYSFLWSRFWRRKSLHHWPAHRCVLLLPYMWSAEFSRTMQHVSAQANVCASLGTAEQSFINVPDRRQARLICFNAITLLNMAPSLKTCICSPLRCFHMTFLSIYCSYFKI
jgi:hypothetical protein